MCIPQRPQPDSYDGLLAVTAHFYATPPLTLIPRGHRYNFAVCKSIVDELRLAVGKVYRKHNLRRCPRYGLYFSGSKAEVENKTNDTIMLLVVELKLQDIEKWWTFDGEVRQILEDWGLSGDPGVCVRYYIFNEHATVEETRFVDPFEEDDTAGPTQGEEGLANMTTQPAADIRFAQEQRLSMMRQIRGGNSDNTGSPQRLPLPQSSTGYSRLQLTLPFIPTS